MASRSYFGPLIKTPSLENKGKEHCPDINIAKRAVTDTVLCSHCTEVLICYRFSNDDAITSPTEHLPLCSPPVDPATLRPLSGVDTDHQTMNIM